MKSQPEIVNVNEAGLERLARLPGIGPTLAERIIEYREANGPFQSPSELSEVEGISRAMASDIEMLVTTNDISEGEEGQGISEDETEEELSDTASDQSADDSPEEVEMESSSEAEIVDDEPADTLEDPHSDEETPITLEDEIRFLPDEEDEGDGEIAEAAAAEAVEQRPMEVGSSAAAPTLVVAPESREPGRTSSSQAAGSPATGDLQAAARGCSFQSVIAGAILGGFFGLLLTTFIIYFLNGGMLQFAGARSLRELENDITTRVSGAQIEQDNLVMQMQTMQALVDDLNDSFGDAATKQAEISGAVNERDDKINNLETTILEMEEKIDMAATAAANFNLFLGGMQEILEDFALTPGAEQDEGSGNMSETAVPLIPISTASPSAAPSGTNTPTPTHTTMPTRTPRPTGTPIVAPSVTP